MSNTSYVDLICGALTIDVATGGVTTTGKGTFANIDIVSTVFGDGYYDANTISTRGFGSRFVVGPTLTWTGLASGASQQYVGAINVTDQRTITAGIGGSGVDTLNALQMAVSIDNTSTFSARDRIVNSFYLVNTDSGVYNNSTAANSTVNNYGENIIMYIQPSFTMGARTETYNAYGSRVWFQSTTPVLNSGTLNQNMYGYYSLMAGNTVALGTSTGYGYYANVAGYDTNYCFYGVAGDMYVNGNGTFTGYGTFGNVLSAITTLGDASGIAIQYDSLGYYGNIGNSFDGYAGSFNDASGNTAIFCNGTYSINSTGNSIFTGVGGASTFQVHQPNNNYDCFTFYNDTYSDTDGFGLYVEGTTGAGFFYVSGNNGVVDGEMNFVFKRDNTFIFCFDAVGTYGATKLWIGYDPFTATGTDNLMVNGTSKLEGNTTVLGDVIVDSDSYGLSLGADQDVLISSNANGVINIASANPTTTDITVNFGIGATTVGQFKWDEDLDYFLFSDEIRVGDTTNYASIENTGVISFGGTGGVMIPHGSYSDSTTQTISSTTVPWAITFNTTEHESLVVKGRTGTVTISNATPAVVTWNTHGLYVDSPVVFTTTEALPAGLTAGTTYYVISAGFGANSFEVSATPQGAAINTTNAGSGTHTATNTSIFTVPSAGFYGFIFSTLYKATNAGTIFDIWLRKNGTNVDRSNTRTATALNNTVAISIADVALDLAAGDKIELFWVASATNGVLEATATQTNPTRPASPSTILTIKKISV